jgi:ferredoxin
MAAQRGGASGVSLVNTFKSVIGIDHDTFSPIPSVGGQGTSGGYCGPAVKPIALHMVTQLGKAPEFELPVSGIGGIHTWEDALDFLLMGASSLQVCTAAMHYGFRIVEEMRRGLEEWMRAKEYSRIEEFRGRALPNYEEWGDLDLNYKIIAEIDPATCIGCQLCYAACEDGAHQAIALQRDTRVPRIKRDECVGCNCARSCGCRVSRWSEEAGLRASRNERARECRAGGKHQQQIQEPGWRKGITQLRTLFLPLRRGPGMRRVQSVDERAGDAPTARWRHRGRRAAHAHRCLLNEPER